MNYVADIQWCVYIAATWPRRVNALAALAHDSLYAHDEFRDRCAVITRPKQARLPHFPRVRGILTSSCMRARLMFTRADVLQLTIVSMALAQIPAQTRLLVSWNS